jgi:hypothetical protein
MFVCVIVVILICFGLVALSTYGVFLHIIRHVSFKKKFLPFSSCCFLAFSLKIFLHVYVFIGFLSCPFFFSVAWFFTMEP